MPSVSGFFNPAIGPLITLHLTPPAVLRRAILSVGAVPRRGPPIRVSAAQALIDTGASITCVTAAMASAANLPLIGKRNLATAGGTVPVNVYVADIAIQFGPLPTPAPSQLTGVGVVAAPATIPNLTILEFQCASPHFQMLLGRDVICQGVLTVSFDNRYTFSI
jgi:hypothetical protein